MGIVDFPVKTSAVKDMFRYKFVMPEAEDLGAGDIPGNPPNWPDADRNDKHFVFVHGYNVNDTQSKGWRGEAFKRLFWSGSNASFTAFGWYGYQGQTFGITPDYQVNLDNAFATAKSFKQFLDLLEGEIPWLAIAWAISMSKLRSAGNVAGLIKAFRPAANDVQGIIWEMMVFRWS